MSKIASFMVLICISSSVLAFDFKPVVKKHIIPGYTELAASTEQLWLQADRRCDLSKRKNLEQLREAYKVAFLDWQAVQHLRTGPIQYLSRESRFQLWPDKRGRVRKHLDQLLSSADLQSPSFDISKQSIAVQGFSALELLLYSREGQHPKSCLAISKITHNLSQISAELLSNWKDGQNAYQKYFIEPRGTEDNLYETDEELAEVLLNNLYTSLELLVSRKLGLPIGENIDKVRPKRAEHWRSDMSLPAIKANLDAGLDLYRLVFAQELPKAQRLMHEQAFNDCKKTLALIHSSLFEAVKRPKQRDMLIQLQHQLSALKRQLATDLTQQLHLSIGFNSLDGD